MSLPPIHEETTSQIAEASGSNTSAQVREERKSAKPKTATHLRGQQSNMTIRMEQEQLSPEIEGLVSELFTSICKADATMETLETQHVLESMQRCYGVEL